MKIINIVGNALSLTRQVWLETIVFAVFIAPVMWGLLKFGAQGGDTTILRFAVMVPQALFTGFSDTILFQAFDNQNNESDIELSMGQLVSLTVSISVATFLVNTIVGFGSMLCMIPGVIAMTGLFLTPVTLFKDDTGVLGALFQSWSKTEGYRLDIFFLLLVGSLLVTLLSVPILGGVVFLGYSNAASGTGDVELIFVGMSAAVGILSAFWLSFSRALEYAVYTEISPSRDQFRRPAFEPAPMSPNAPQPGEPTAPTRPPRGPITVDHDIVFGEDAEDGEEW